MAIFQGSGQVIGGSATGGGGSVQPVAVKAYSNYLGTIGEGGTYDTNWPAGVAGDYVVGIANGLINNSQVQQGVVYRCNTNGTAPMTPANWIAEPKPLADDSGWINIPSNSLFLMWAAANTASRPGYRKVGQVVTVAGSIMKAVSSDSIPTLTPVSETVFTLPVGYRPERDFAGIAESGLTSMVFKIRTDGSGVFFANPLPETVTFSATYLAA